MIQRTLAESVEPKFKGSTPFRVERPDKINNNHDTNNNISNDNDTNHNSSHSDTDRASRPKHLLCQSFNDVYIHICIYIYIYIYIHTHTYIHT